NSFNDLVVEVAIIRPGPIQGNAVHPYIRRKQGREPVTYLHPLLEPILRDTLGVILYQEQILEICIAVAGMTAGQADGFRRAMNRHRSHIEMRSLHDGFHEGCLQNDVSTEIAEELFHAIEGFAAFGFCRSHAAAFARTSYETAWLRIEHPAEYYCGLLNNQPMGFYHPSVLVEDAKRHGTAVLPVDINRSADRCLPEGDHALRLGFNYVKELGVKPREAIFKERAGGDFTSFDDFQDRLQAQKVATGRTLRVGGLVIVRQAPGTAKKLRFFTIEDELGHVNVTFMPDVYERYRKVANSNSILVIEGVMQRQDGVHSVLA